MSKSHVSARKLAIGLALVAILTTALTLGAVAQNPNNPEPVGNSEAGNAQEKVTVVEEEELLFGASEPNTSAYYKRYSADVFVPLSPSFNWAHWGVGCVYHVSGDSTSAHNLQLPDGAEITYLRIYFYDSDPINDARVNLNAFDAQGNYTFIGTATSSGTPGWSSVGSGFLSHFVNNLDEALHLRLDYENSDDGTLRICGVRVQYQYSLARTSLPLVLNESNP